jgi:hypothetical protein
MSVIAVSTALVLKRWKERYASLKKGVLTIWMDRSAMLRGDSPVEEIELTSNMALSSMKVNSNNGNPARIFYRHIAELEPGTVLTTVGGTTNAGEEDAPGTRRVFKFGSDNQPEFEKWSKSVRAAIDNLGHVRS